LHRCDAGFAGRAGYCAIGRKRDKNAIKTPKMPRAHFLISFSPREETLPRTLELEYVVESEHARFVGKLERPSSRANFAVQGIE
jgi:hypothetical protein